MTHTFLKDIGGRTEQQDSVGIFKIDHKIFMVLADGMGGHEGGKLASNTLLNIAEDKFLLHHKQIKTPYSLFTSIVEETKDELKKLSKGTALDPNTTAVFVLIDKYKLYYAYLGDSRFYLFEKNKQLIFRTRDDSLPEMLFKNNEITEDEISTHPQQNVLTKSIGINSTDSLSFGTITLSPYKEYRILLGSDGLWALLNEVEMYQELFSLHPLALSSKKLLSMAKYRGGSNGDNISIATVIVKKKKISNYIPLIVFIIAMVSILYFFSSPSKLPLDINSTNSIPLNEDIIEQNITHEKQFWNSSTG